MIRTRLERMVRKMKMDLTGMHCQCHIRIHSFVIAGVPPKSKEVGQDSSKHWSYGNAEVSDCKSQ